MRKLALALIACANTEMAKPEPAMSEAASATSASPSQMEYEKALTAAKAAVKEAAAVGGEWRDTGKALEMAEKAAAAGDYGTAIKHAERARFEGEMGQRQAMEQVDAGNPDYLLNR